MKGDRDFCKAAVAQNGECRAASANAPSGNVCLWSTEPHLLKNFRIRPASGKLADRLEGRMSTGDSERACYGFGCEDMLLLKRTAKSSPLNYPGNLGRTCRRQIRHTANARTETFRKLATVAEGFIYFVWPQSEVGAHTALLLNAFVGLL